MLAHLLLEAELWRFAAGPGRAGTGTARPDLAATFRASFRRIAALLPMPTCPAEK